MKLGQKVKARMLRLRHAFEKQIDGEHAHKQSLHDIIAQIRNCAIASEESLPELLRETGIGKVLNSQRKGNSIDEETKTLISRLVTEWKNRVHSRDGASKSTTKETTLRCESRRTKFPIPDNVGEEHVSISYFSGSKDLLKKQLSNFYPSPLELGQRYFVTAEHAFHAFKHTSSEYRDTFTKDAKGYCGDDPRKAKKAGGKNGVMKKLKITLRPDWNSARVQIMKSITLAKYRQNPDLAAVLIGTGTAELLHQGFRIDKYWGVQKQGGLNMHGKILMETRQLLNQEGEDGS